MLDAVYIALTGLQGASRGLNEVANNTANLNTPGFKSGSVPLTDLFYSAGALGQKGHGVRTNESVRNFSQGEIRATGGALDLAIDGAGYFVLQTPGGERRYTRAGRFGVGADGGLQNLNDGAAVLGTSLSAISVEKQRKQPGRGTSVITLRGNLSSTAEQHQIAGVKIFDPAGAERTVTISAKRDTQALEPAWMLSLVEGATTLAETVVPFKDGAPQQQKPTLNFSTSAGAQSVVLDLSSEVTSFAGGAGSSLAVLSQDGYAEGSLIGVAFDVNGKVLLRYSNGQTVEGETLALANFAPGVVLQPEGASQFSVEQGGTPLIGRAGQAGFGTLRPESLEASNVNLTRELSDVIALQRGYQASSQVLGTASEMLEKLFALGGRSK